ncbi:PotD/PotF family extracellular solute-binding protein [Pelagibius sp. Alg239-R121]|uniref:ABC transporter substrate-binding protein n=1 Tax=Pelagibius sp. Alg239-R121 TaxID=2993448 RepID=UPI0024A796B2|nr:extracellular solute-binding protein [Pelagibius sp. Alg239-R121]
MSVETVSGGKSVSTSKPAPTSAPAVSAGKPVLRVLGTSVTQIEPLRKAAQEDLGIVLDFITLDGTEAQRRGVLAPQSFDVYDQWFHDIDLIWPTGSIQGIDVSRIDRWEQINALPKTGRLSPHNRSAGGGDPSKRLYVQLDGSLGDAPSDFISMLPTVHNADSFAGVGADPKALSSWGSLLDPEWAGRAVLQSDAAIGSLDMLLAARARGEFDAEDIGNLSLEEIAGLTDLLRGYRKRGHFRRYWADEAEAVAAMQEQKPVIGSLWWSGVIKLRARGVPVVVATPEEGYRGWFGGMALSVHIEDRVLDAAYEYLNWWLDGYAGAMMARNGAYMSNPEAVRPHLSANEWAFWYEGKPARDAITDPDGCEIYAPGDAREGGSYSQRMSRIVVWDAVMDEHNYLVRRWEHALSGR